MAFKDDIQVILNKVGTNLVGNLKEEYGQAAMDSLAVGTFQPLMKFYNDNEQELRDKYGISLNDILGLNQTTQTTLLNLGTPKQVAPPIAELVEQTPAEKREGIIKELALPLLGIIAGGAAIFIIIKTLKK